MSWLSRDERLNLKDDNCWNPINGQIKLSVRENTCVVNWRWRTVLTRNATQEVPKKLKNLEDAALREEMEYLDKSWIKNILCSMIRNIKFGNYMIEWKFFKIRKNLPRPSLTEQILEVPTFHIKLLSSRVPKSLAAKQTAAKCTRE